MATLGQIPTILENISSAAYRTVKALHKLVFGNNEGRKSRRHLRKSSGFNFEVNSFEHNNKLQFIRDNFTTNELILIANTLYLDYNGTNDELINRIYYALSD